MRLKDFPNALAALSARVIVTTSLCLVLFPAPDSRATNPEGALRLTELMYNSPGGSAYDFLELHNAGTTAIQIGGFAFTDGIDFVIPAGTTLAPGAYLVVTKASTPGDIAAFRTHYGLAATVPIVGPYAGNLGDAGEEITLRTDAAGDVLIRVTYSDDRGWPISADGVGHSLVPRRDFGSDSNLALNFGGNWRPSAYLLGSPGKPDPELDSPIVLNEVVAHTDFLGEFDSNDWIELYNRGSTSVALGDGWYLSDSAANLRFWRIPAGTVIPPKGFLVFDEVSAFNQPRGTGFGINKAGETVFLSHFPAGAPGRVVDAVSFEAQENDWAVARIPDGGDYWDAVKPRSRQTSNPPLAPRVAISELHFHPENPASAALSTDEREFVELHNSGSVSVDLFNPHGTWRLAGGVDFAFAELVSLTPGERVLFVGWNPATEPKLVDAFRRAYALAIGVRIFGPFTGRLSNEEDRITLERPQAPDLPGDPITWVIADEVTYRNGPPWPGGIGGNGQSYQRLSAMNPGNDPANWLAAPATPGAATPLPNLDSDGDGLPDAWETRHGLDPKNAGDAKLDLDRDGMSTLAEYLAGTDPTHADSVLRILSAASVDSATGSALELRFSAVAGKKYLIESASSPSSPTWTAIQTVPPPSTTETVTVRIPLPVNLAATEMDSRYHRPPLDQRRLTSATTGRPPVGRGSSPELASAPREPSFQANTSSRIFRLRLAE